MPFMYYIFRGGNMQLKKLLSNGIILYTIKNLYEYNIHRDGLITVRALSAKVVKEDENGRLRYIIIFDENGNPERGEVLNELFWAVNKGKSRMYSMDSDTDAMIARIRQHYTKRAEELEQQAAEARRKAEALHVI